MHTFDSMSRGPESLSISNRFQGDMMLLVQGLPSGSEDVMCIVHHEDEGGGHMGPSLGCLSERGRECPFLAEGVWPGSWRGRQGKMTCSPCSLVGETWSVLPMSPGLMGEAWRMGKTCPLGRDIHT